MYYLVRKKATWKKYKPTCFKKASVIKSTTAHLHFVHVLSNHTQNTINNSKMVLPHSTVFIYMYFNTATCHSLVLIVVKDAIFVLILSPVVFSPRMLCGKSSGYRKMCSRRHVYNYLMVELIGNLQMAWIQWQGRFIWSRRSKFNIKCENIDTLNCMKNLTLYRLRLWILTNERSNKNRSIDSARKLINLIGLTEIPNDKCKRHVTRSLVNFLISLIQLLPLFVSNDAWSETCETQKLSTK